MKPSFSHQIVLWLRSHILSVMIVVLVVGGFSYAAPYGGSIPVVSNVGKYQVSCAANSPGGWDYVRCVRMDTITGVAECKSMFNAATWTSCPTPW